MVYHGISPSTSLFAEFSRWYDKRDFKKFSVCLYSLPIYIYIIIMIISSGNFKITKVLLGNLYGLIWTFRNCQKEQE